MLAELAVYALTPVPWRHRRFGLLFDAVSLWTRSRRCASVWAPHHARARDVISRAMANLPRRRKVVVLGSGLVSDVPIEEMARLFERVVLVDAVHLFPVRRRLRHLGNVEFVIRDLTGAIDWIAGASAARREPLADIAADKNVDLVVSANLLSQMPYALESYLERRPRRAAILPPDLPARSVGWHLDDLATLRGRVCLITDLEARDVDAGGRPVGEPLDLMRGHVLPEPAESWDWTLAPPGEDHPTQASIHRVAAWPDLRAASA
jgi:hypothetical protein